MTTKTDYLGIPINIGNKVAYLSTRYRANRIETVVGFTEHKVTVTDSCMSEESTISVYAKNLLVINDQIKANHINYPELLL
jgi:hypothetical protein